MEVPEIDSGSVQVKAIAREAGSRTKIAVLAQESGVDPIGSLVGQKGVRVQTVINELSGEKIDIILWSDKPKDFITNALSPAKILDTKIVDNRILLPNVVSRKKQVLPMLEKMYKGI